MCLVGGLCVNKSLPGYCTSDENYQEVVQDTTHESLEQGTSLSQKSWEGPPKADPWQMSGQSQEKGECDKPKTGVLGSHEVDGRARLGSHNSWGPQVFLCTPYFFLPTLSNPLLNMALGIKGKEKQKPASGMWIYRQECSRQILVAKK